MWKQVKKCVFGRYNDYLSKNEFKKSLQMFVEVFETFLTVFGDDRLRDARGIVRKQV